MFDDVKQGPFTFSYNGDCIVVYDINSRVHSFFYNYKPKTKEEFKNICHYLYLKKMKKIL